MGDLQQAIELCRTTAFRDCIWRHLGSPRRSNRETLRLDIHPKDQMLLHSLRSFDANTAVSQYFNVALQQHRAVGQVLHAFFEARRDFRMLDFACGYGRLLRLLTVDLPVARIWASEIQPDALDFVGRQFGVATISSSASPMEFHPGTRFNLIWVASLFSHLPRELFHAWLGRLVDLLEQDGVLCFSVLDMTLLPATARHEELVFTPQSENADLDGRLYGTTFATEAFVRSAVAKLGRHACVRLPRALAHEQDLYVVSAGRDLAPLGRFRRGPWGFVDIARVSADRELYLTGWVASLDDGPLAAVEVAVDGRAEVCPVDGTRPDVGDALNDRRLDRSGWEFRRRLAATRAFVEVSAATSSRETALLYAGFL